MSKLAIIIITYNRYEPFFNVFKQMLLQIEQSPYKNGIELCIFDNGSNIDITNEIKKIKSTTDIEIKFQRFSENSAKSGVNIHDLYIFKNSDSEYCWLFGDDDILSEDTAIDTIMEALYEKSADVITFPFINRNIYGEQKDEVPAESIVLYPSVNSLESRLFDFSLKKDYDLWFSGINNKPPCDCVMFIFLSNVIFKRSNWEKYVDEKSFKLHVQAYIHLKTLLNGGILQYINVPLVTRNNSFDSNYDNKHLYMYLSLTYELISYFFEGELEDRLYNAFFNMHISQMVRISPDTTDEKKEHLKNMQIHVHNARARLLTAERLNVIEAKLDTKLDNLTYLLEKIDYPERVLRVLKEKK